MDYDVAGLNEELQSYLSSTQNGEANFGAEPKLGKLSVSPDGTPYAKVVFLSRLGELYDLAHLNLDEGTYTFLETDLRSNVKEIKTAVESFADNKGLEQLIPHNPT